MTVLDDRLPLLDTFTLNEGKHSKPRTKDGAPNQACAMELTSWLAGEPFSDHPACTSKVLTSFVISLNDQWDNEQRQTLKPFLPRLIGTAGDGLDETRSYMALDWLIRTYTPAWLDLAGLTADATALREHRRIVDLVAAQSVRPHVDTARKNGAAAWDAARAAAGDAAWAAARAAAWDAARDAAWAAAWAAAWDAAWDAAGAAAGAAAWDAARDAAWAAARAALKPTVTTLQTSALDLLDHMIDGKWTA